MKRKSRLKRFARIIAGQSPPSAQVVDHDEHALSFLQGNAEFTGTSPVPVKACDTAPKRARAGDILLSVRAPVGALNIADQSYGIGRGLCAIRSICADQRFLWWALQDSVDDLQSRATGSTYEAVSIEDVADTLIPTPPLTIQRAIADYLDTETGRIDALITKKRRMIQLLEERWMALAESVLCRFEAVPLKRYVTKIGSGSTPRGGADVYVSSGPVFLRSQNIRGGVIDLSDVVFIDRLAQDQLRRALVRPGDVLLNITGGSIGRAAVMDRSDIQAYVSQHVCIVRSVPGVDAWVLWAELSSQSVQEQIAVVQVGGNREGLNFEQVGNLLVRIPSIDQSQAIAQVLATGLQVSKRTTETLGSQIELLVERRRALITSAVTGELGVVV
ncbi:MAG: restriction endonuclease subunit S [Acidimicrobiia bacterium]|nr:restriction endonuclease subunit S [Acidimicrobiia bacterium]